MRCSTSGGQRCSDKETSGPVASLAEVIARYRVEGHSLFLLRKLKSKIFVNQVLCYPLTFTNENKGLGDF